jgi:two-component system chemotaxis response regulator CheB
MHKPKFVIVIGASAGGLNSVIELCAQMTNDIDAAVLVVLHLPQISNVDILIQRIKSNSSFDCQVATNEGELKRGVIYMADPDRHLLVKDGKTLIGQGPPENRWRPSIDILFRSAAVAYRGRAIGIILSGLMQDGTAGMIAIQQAGGTCIVQDPEEAEYPDMPKSVMSYIEPDYCVSLTQMGTILKEKTRNGHNLTQSIPEHLMAEAAIAERVALGIENVQKLGERSNYSCPDCGGGLWEIIDDNLVRYRCHTGHSYNSDELYIRQTESLENTLWVALRMLDERKDLMKKMAKEESRKGWTRSSQYKLERVAELEIHTDRIKEILFKTQKQNTA